MKRVSLVGHSFDCLPGHVTIGVQGEGFNLRVAASRAVQTLLSNERLRGKQVNDFKMTLVVIKN